MVKLISVDNHGPWHAFLVAEDKPVLRLGAGGVNTVSILWIKVKLTQRGFHQLTPDFLLPLGGLFHRAHGGNFGSRMPSPRIFSVAL